MRIAVFGAGAVGGYFGGRLAHAGEDVFFIARGSHLRALEENGLKVESINGNFHLEQIHVSDDPVQAGKRDVILLGVKAWQIPQAALAIRPMIGEDTIVVPLCNGVTASSQLELVLGRKHVVGGLCRISAFIQQPGVIRHVGITPYIAFGDLDGRHDPRCEKLRDAFLRADVLAEVSKDIVSAIWQKFIFIAAISGVGAITRVPVGALRQIPETRNLLIDSMKEIFMVAQARGIQMPEGVVEKTLTFVDGLSPAVIPSMQRDMMQGKPSELEALVGAVVRLGKDSGVETEVNKLIYTCLLPQEIAARNKISH